MSDPEIDEDYELHPRPDEYRVVLTPRSFMMARNDWHIQVISPKGNEVWSSAPYKWAAELKARYIVRQMKAGKYKDRRKIKVFRI